jgi:two-component system, sensor histidine kinase and response regulator
LNTPPISDLQGATLLIVDDQPQNLRLVSDFLAEQGFDLMLARSGAQALEQVTLAKPDLILLDVRMPRMDGFEVCRRLKAAPASVDIPVIFMTAEDETAQKVTAFSLGAVDYITKPIQRDELLARIRLHLQLHRLQTALFHQTQALASKNMELEAYAHTIAHNLKTPLAASSRFLEILYKFKSENLSKEQLHLVERTMSMLATTGGAIDAMLLLSTVSNTEVELHSLDMQGIVQRVNAQLVDLCTLSQTSVTLPGTWPKALGYAPWIAEVWLNLISNALKYSGLPPRITVGGEREGAQVRYWVRDNGVPLSQDACQRVFQPFTRLQSERAEGHGLGLVTVQRIVAKLGGVAQARGLAEGGNEFSFTLPPVSES